MSDSGTSCPEARTGPAKNAQSRANRHRKVLPAPGNSDSGHLSISFAAQSCRDSPTESEFKRSSGRSSQSIVQSSSRRLTDRLAQSSISRFPHLSRESPARNSVIRSNQSIAELPVTLGTNCRSANQSACHSASDWASQSASSSASHLPCHSDTHPVSH